MADEMEKLRQENDDLRAELERVRGELSATKSQLLITKSELDDAESENETKDNLVLDLKMELKKANKARDKAIEAMSAVVGTDCVIAGGDDESDDDDDDDGAKPAARDESDDDDAAAKDDGGDDDDAKIEAEFQRAMSAGVPAPRRPLGGALMANAKDSLGGDGRGYKSVSPSGALPSSRPAFGGSRSAADSLDDDLYDF